MIRKQLLLTLIFSGYTGIALSQSATPDTEEKPLIVPAEKLENINITKEESFYIYTECKQFAVDDEIETEYVDDYITLCSHELTQAVKTAKYRLRKKGATVTPVKSTSSNAPKPI